jgi:hypothetical protein
MLATIALIALFLGERPVRADADVGFQTAAVTGVDMPALSTRLALGGVAHRMWTPLPPLALGLRVSLSATSLAYGNNDGEPVIGRRSGYSPDYLEDAFTVLPSLAFALRWQPGDLVRVTGSVGAGFIVSSEMKEFSMFPLPTAGVAVDVRIPGTEGLRVRAGVDRTVVHSWTEGLVLLHLGLIWDL